jgi:3-hydroxymyristoyl/3-hydroxydecanoyl-(acyl carrier protein) dehydratase/1-acyl-sn-glycerol-3-phosphate acyltransferase
MDRRVEFNSQMECVPLLPDSEVRPVHLRIDALGGQSACVQIGSPPQTDHRANDRTAAAAILGAIPDIYTYAAPDIAGLIRALDTGRCNPSVADKRGLRLAIVSAAENLPDRLRTARTFLNRVESGEINGLTCPEGISFRRGSVEGDLAFVFTGASTAYTGMGRDLLLALPGLAPSQSKADWVYRFAPDSQPNDFERLCGSSFLSQVHARFTQQVLGLRPNAAIGLSSGETNSMYALGAWQSMQGLLLDIEACGLYTTVLGGRADAIRAAWKERGIEDSCWSSYWVTAPVLAVQAAVAAEPGVHITIINSPEDVVIGGESRACRRVAQKIGLHRAALLGGDFAAHTPEVGKAADLWRRLHHRPTTQPEGIRFYSNALGRSYHLTADSVADALTLQALETIDFPRTIQAAWDDGIRIFVEHGPRNQCTQSIRSILADRQFVAVPFDVASRPSLTQAMYATAELWTAGVKVDIAALRAAVGLDRAPAARREDVMRLPAHLLPPDVVMMTPAPALAPVTQIPLSAYPDGGAQQNPAGSTAVAASLQPALSSSQPSGLQGSAVQATPGFHEVMTFHARISAAHQEHLRQMALLDQAYQETQARLLQIMGSGAVSAPAIGLTFTREQLEIHASGRISDIFGPEFAAQDGFQRRVRMPEPPLLLADRVTSLDAEPLSLGLGSITTETDVTPEAWYLHQGRMPAGIMVESGQADLMLISWLGVDDHNKSERVYRLLGCDLSFHGQLPRPGETLRYDIHVDRHAVHAGVRIFFFHYDCTTAGQLRLAVRNGHAGFFTNEELAGSEGVLWSAATGAHTAAEKARMDPPPCLTSRRSFETSDLRALIAGLVAECFGDGFELAYTHTRTPVAQNDRMQLLQRIPVFDPAGGPWKRGYLRAEWDVCPDEWFFPGHFKNDPCMPGTLMVEGCLQAMAFYLSALGFTLERDGWRFEPVPDTRYSLRCRGQVVPSSKLLVYEVFVDEIIAGPTPTIYADVLCTVDGLTACHCARLGLRLVPDWPLEETLAMASNNIPFDYESLLACALGRPSHAFGPAFERFDGVIKVPRLPRDPYHVMSRIVHVEQTGSAGGSVAETEYDVPPDAWYFSENGHAVMPMCILTEVLLQPCGWLASFAGTWKKADQDIFFRNLGGGGTVHVELGPASGTLRIRATLRSCSEMDTISITEFAIVCRAGERTVFDGYAVFGHFPADALKNQTGLPPAGDELRWFREKSPQSLDVLLPNSLDALQTPQIGRGKLRMIDRISGYWPQGGKAGLGRLRSELDVHPGLWFFQAHFFGDPVQPGSLGLEAVVQTLQVWMIATGKHNGLHNPRFESIATGEAVSWTFRGQVVPASKRVTILLEVLEAAPSFAKARASLWVDGIKIYSIPSVAMRVVSSGPAEDAAEDAAEDRAEDPAGDNEKLLDPAIDTWLKSHCPTYTVPALPMMVVADRIAAAAHRAEPQKQVIEVRDVTLNGWITFPSGPRRLKTEASVRDTDIFDVRFLVWREAPHAALSRFEQLATAAVKVGDEYPLPPAPLPALTDGEPAPSPYDSGELFHGPDFQFVQQLVRSSAGSSFLLDSEKGSVPRGFLNQGLLDGAMHGIPIENLHLWSDRIPRDRAGYPSRIIRLSLFAESPADGRSRCEVRFVGFHQEDVRFPRFIAQLTDDDGIWAELEVVYALFPKGPIGSAPPADRRAFLLFKQFVPGMHLGSVVNEETLLRQADLYENDWLPGTVESAFGLRSADRLTELAIKQQMARELHVHPAAIVVSDSGDAFVPNQYPVNRFPVSVSKNRDHVRIRSVVPPPVDCSIVRQFWEKLNGLAEWPIADLHCGLIERFIRRIEFTDPDMLGNIRGKPVLFLANHQVAIESILFIVAASALCDLPIKTIAKTEHQQTWMGKLIALTRTYPGFNGPDPIFFFDRNDPGALLKLLRDFRSTSAQSPASLMVHVDGTRALSCRTAASQVSSVLLDVAMDLNLPVVPVRFVGGLPSTPVPQRLELPFGAGQQDIRMGRPIPAEVLRACPLAERSKMVLQAINGLAIPNEESFGADPSALPLRTAFVDALRHTSHRCSATEELLSVLAGAGSGAGSWLHSAKSWLDGLDR